MMEEGRSGALKGKGRGAIALPSSGLTGCQIKEAHRQEQGTSSLESPG